MINDAALAKMKPGAVLINTARGALVEMLPWPGRCTAAIWDFSAQMWSASSRSARTIRCWDVTTRCSPPHIAWTTAESLARLSAVMTENLRSFLAGKPQNIAN